MSSLAAILLQHYNTADYLYSNVHCTALLTTDIPRMNTRLLFFLTECPLLDKVAKIVKELVGIQPVRRSCERDRRRRQPDVSHLVHGHAGIDSQPVEKWVMSAAHTVVKR